MMPQFGAGSGASPITPPTGLMGVAGMQPPAPSPASGLMGLMRDPRMMAALMGASGSLMAAGGPSQTPVNFGQGLGAGMQGGMGGFMLGQQQQDMQQRQAERDELMKRMMTLLGPMAGSTPRGMQEPTSTLMSF